METLDETSAITFNLVYSEGICGAIRIKIGLIMYRFFEMQQTLFMINV